MGTSWPACSGLEGDWKDTVLAQPATCLAAMSWPRVPGGACAAGERETQSGCVGQKEGFGGAGVGNDKGTPSSSSGAHLWTWSAGVGCDLNHHPERLGRAG